MNKAILKGFLMNKENEKINQIELEAIKSKLSNEFGKNLNTLANVCKSENIERIVDTFIIGCQVFLIYLSINFFSLINNVIL